MTDLADRKYRRIASAGHALFAQHGFDAVTMDQIADAADVSVRTVHNLFGSKVGVYFSDRSSLVAHVEAIKNAAGDVSALSAIAASLAEHYPGAEKYPTPQLKGHAAAIWLGFEEELVAVLRARDGGRKSGFEYRLEAALVVTLLRSLQWKERHESDTPYGATTAGQRNLVADLATVFGEAVAGFKSRVEEL